MKKIILLLFLPIFQVFFAQSDCASAIPICDNSSINYTPSSSGSTQDPLGSVTCLSTEHYSVWYSFTVATGGTLTFLITPNGLADYDWAVYGPNKTCSTRGNPIRCSFASPYSAGTYLTGLNMTATNTTDSSGGTGFCQYMTVTAGQTYYLMIDNWSFNTTGFSLTFGGTATLESPFNAGPGQPVLNPFVNPSPLLICSTPALFDFSTLTPTILNGNANFNVTYYTTQNNALTGTSPITAPITVSAATTYYYRIKSTLPNSTCAKIGPLNFTIAPVNAVAKTISSCEINQSGTALWNLTTAAVFTSSTIPYVIKYYPTAANAAAGTNEITNPTAYTAGQGTVYAKVTRTDVGCSSIVPITLTFGPKVQLLTYDTTITICADNFDGVKDAVLSAYDTAFTTDPSTHLTYYLTLQDAYDEVNPVTTQTITNTKTFYIRAKKAGLCDNFAKVTLNVDMPTEKSVEVCDTDLDGKVLVYLSDYADQFTNNSSGVSAVFYNNKADAIAQTNAINTQIQVSGIKTFYIRIKDATTCDRFGILHVTVKVPQNSPNLKDQTICVENTTTLDAGTGFASYEWSTGDTTPSITNVGLGTYWVNLTSANGCSYRQTVQVKAAPQVTISNIEISNNTVTIIATGGTEPYQYSIDGVNWQSSNVFNDVPRGNSHIYVKDAFNCNAVDAEITVPNIINVITPNGDGTNDVLDYSSLAYKKDLTFTIYDRYGSKVFVGDKNNNYIWDGRYAGKVNTGNYWYVITWTEPDDAATPVKYSGWIMVKNRN